jgi:hypothetical protein
VSAARPARTFVTRFAWPNRAASPDGPGRWLVPSVDEDGVRLDVVVVIEAGVLVVSLFG